MNHKLVFIVLVELLIFGLSKEESKSLDNGELPKISESFTPGLDSLFIHELGIVLEEIESYALQDGHLFIPYIFEVADPQEVFLLGVNNPCTADLAIKYQKILTAWNQKWKDMIPVRSKNPLIPDLVRGPKTKINNSSISLRKKRFLSVVLGGLSVAGSIWNRVSISSLEGSIKQLRNQHIESWSKIKENRHMINTIGDQINKAAVYLKTISADINSILNQQECETIRDLYLEQLMVQFNLVGPSLFSKVLDFSMSGQIIPEFLPLSKWKSIIEEIVDLHETIYKEVPSLVYQVGEFFLDGILADPYRITGVLIVPRIFSSRMGPIFSVGQVPFVFNNTTYQFNSPSQIAVSSEDQIAWSPSFEECRRTPGLMVCHASASIRSQDSCLSSLLFRKGEAQCRENLIRKRFNPPQVLRSGVLVGADIKMISISTIKNGRVLSQKVELNGKPYLATPNQGDYVIINGSHYSLRLFQESYTLHSLKFSLPGPKNHSNNPQFPLAFIKSLEDLGEEPPYVLKENTTLWIWVMVLGILISLTLSLLILYKRRNILAWVSLRSPWRQSITKNSIVENEIPTIEECLSLRHSQS